MSLIRRHPLITFFVLAYVLAWGAIPWQSFGAYAPLLAALIVIPISQGWAGLRELGFRIIRWRVRWYWYVVAIGLPLAVHLATVGLRVAAGAGVPSLAFSSMTSFLLVFAVRLINPVDGPMGEEPGWRGFALPGLQVTLSPLLATLILAALITGWHLPLFFLEEGGLEPSFILTAALTTVAVTFWYTWLFNHTGGSVLMVIVAHSLEGSIQAGGWIYMGVWCAVAIGLVVFNWKAWRGSAAAGTTTPPVIPSREATSVAP
jgi:membrane protease YdiL (CAAX protease family)